MTVHRAPRAFALALAGAFLVGCESGTKPPVPAQLSFSVQPASVVAGVTMAPSVQVAIQDASGSTVTNATLDVTIAFGANSSSGVLAGTKTVAAVAGIATFPGLTIEKAGTGYTFVAASSGLTSATSSAFDVTAAAPSQLAFTTQPASVTAGAAITPSVTVAIQDAFGNVTNATSEVTLAFGTNAGSGTLAGTTSATAVAGVATFADLNINKASAGYTLSATATGLTAATSAAFAIVAGAVAKIEYTTQPSNAIAGTAIPVAVRVLDALDNVVTASSAPVTIAIASNPAGGTLAGTATVNAASGVATFSDLSIQKAGAGYTLSASTSGATALVSTAFAISPAAPAKLVFQSQPPASVAGGEPFTLQAALFDAFNNATTTATNTVTLAITNNASSEATLHGTTSVPAAAGVAAFPNLWIDRAGLGYEITASSGTMTTANTSPVTVNVVFSSLSAGGTDGHTCAVTTTGYAYCWGNNSSGQLGDGTTTSHSRPVLVSGRILFDSVSAGARHTCGVAKTSVVYCWGDNTSGQLGDGGNTQRLTPTPVSGTFAFTSVVAGDASTCALTNAGAAYCWGLNSSSQLGDGTTMNRQVPNAVSGGLTFIQISIDSAHACGVNTINDGYCWGDNTSGQLGDGTMTSRSVPTMLASKWARIYPGLHHTCAMPFAGLSCWGSNSNQQIGDGNTSTSARLNPTTVTGGLTPSSVSAGYYYNCAYGNPSGETSEVWCWGHNGNGQRGDGTLAESAFPVVVSRPDPNVFFQPFTLDAGRYHTCVRADHALVGDIYCWGANGAGQLGDGSTVQRTTPVRVRK